MFNHTLIKRTLTAAVVIGAAAFPTASQAMPDRNDAPSFPAQVAPSQAPSASAPSSDDWGSVGIVGGAIVLFGAGAAGSTAARRRRGHRTVTG